MLQPLRRRVWAPRGDTPIQYAWDRHDRITALVAITRAPWAARLGLHYTLLDHNARAPDFVQFIRDIHTCLHRPIILVCDRLKAHQSAIHRLAERHADWLKVEWLPPYAPDLNPVEDVWSQSKYGDLANFIPDDIDNLREALGRLLEIYRHEPNRLHSFLNAAHLST